MSQSDKPRPAHVAFISKNNVLVPLCGKTGRLTFGGLGRMTPLEVARRWAPHMLAHHCPSCRTVLRRVKRIEARGKDVDAEIIAAETHRANVDAALFTAFGEHLPRFPPSDKRRRGSKWPSSTPRAVLVEQRAVGHAYDRLSAAHAAREKHVTEKMTLESYLDACAREFEEAFAT